MTNITTGELRIILFCLFFGAILSGFMAMYSESTIVSKQRNIERSVNQSVNSTSSSSWIAGLIEPLPAPLNDTKVLIIFSIFLVPISIMLAPIAIRYLKDLATQWI